MWCDFVAHRCWLRVVISERLFNWLWTRLNNWLETIKSMQSNNNLIALRFVKMVIYTFAWRTPPFSSTKIQLHQTQILSILSITFVSFQFISFTILLISHYQRIQHKSIKSSNFYWFWYTKFNPKNKIKWMKRKRNVGKHLTVQMCCVVRLFIC